MVELILKPKMLSEILHVHLDEAQKGATLFRSGAKESRISQT